jgi:hypothetical protein
MTNMSSPQSQGLIVTPRWSDILCFNGLICSSYLEAVILTESQLLPIQGKKKKKSNINASSGIRTPYPIVIVGEEFLYLRQPDQCERYAQISWYKYGQQP